MNLKRGTRRVAILSGVIVSIFLSWNLGAAIGTPSEQAVEILWRGAVFFVVGFVPIWCIGWVIRGFQRTRDR